MLAFLSIVICLIIYGCLACIMPERLRRASLSNREDLSLKEILTSVLHQHCINEAEAKDAFLTIARLLCVRHCKLRLTDRLDRELRCTRFFPLVDINENLTLHLAGLSRKANVRLSGEKLITVQDCLFELIKLRQMTRGEQNVLMHEQH